MAKKELEKRQKDDKRKIDGLIRWRKTDILTLQNAVNNFNRTRKKLLTEENRTFLPDERNFDYLRETISTRKEFNRMVESLNSFSNKNKQKILRLPSRNEKNSMGN